MKKRAVDECRDLGRNPVVFIRTIGLDGMLGRFYQRRLSPARDSLAHSRPALRAFAAAANS